MSRDNATLKSRKSFRQDDLSSMITSDALIILRKRYFFPTDLVVVSPKEADRARSPPPGYLTVYEMNLRAGIRFPLAPEFVSILMTYGICLSQLSFRALVIIMGLIVFFRERKSKLSQDFLARMCKVSSDLHDRVTCKGRQIDFETIEAPRNWSSRYFYVKNEWDLIDKWGPLKEYPIPIRVQEEDIARALNMRDVDELHFKIKFLNQFVTEDALFKVGLSIQPGRSHAHMVKKSKHDIGKSPPAATASPKRRDKMETENNPLKRKRDADFLLDSEDMKIHVPEDILNHSCLGHQRINAGVNTFAYAYYFYFYYYYFCTDIGFLQLFQLNKDSNEWNMEFVKLKYFYGEYKRRYNSKAKELFELEDQLAGCRTELSTMATSLSLQRQEVDRSHDELVETRTSANDAIKKLKSSEARVLTLESENQLLRQQLLGKETSTDESKVIQAFKKSYAFKTMIQERIEKARARIFDIEVKDLENQMLEEGFIRGFLKGIRVVHRKYGVNIEDLSPSQASADPTPQEVEDDAESNML